MFEKIVNVMDSMELKGRDVATVGGLILLFGVIIGMLVSPKGTRMIGCKSNYSDSCCGDCEE